MADKPVKTIADIAELAGVSKSTVSRALSNSPLISEETRSRIQALARQHNFQINQPARSLSLKQSNTIAFVTHGYYEQIGVEDLFLLEMLGSISIALANMHYDLLMVNVDPYDTEWISDYLNTGKVDGFVLMTSTRKQHHIHRLIEMKAPFIAWGIPAPGVNYCTVTGDNFTGGRLAAEHLLSLGKQKIAFLGGPAEEQEVRLRFKGFDSALKLAGLAVDPKRVVYGDYSSEAGTKMMFKLLDQNPGLDAVFTNSDLVAIGAINAIRERGLRVPEDVSVIGYDDISLAQYCNPPLTTIHQNITESGRLLVQNLIQYLETGIITNVAVPVELVVRASTNSS
ncbi:MAG: LacI family DNA-binding transcriptional regulator [Chloroflexota bacterium]